MHSYYVLSSSYWTGRSSVAQMLAWCRERFGVEHEDSWYYQDFTFYFKRRRDLVLFILMWS